MLVEREVGDQSFETAILIFELAQATQLGDTHAVELFLPPIESLFGDAEPSTDVEDGRTTLGLFKRVGDLFLRELRFLNRPSWAVEGQILAEF